MVIILEPSELVSVRYWNPYPLRHTYGNEWTISGNISVCSSNIKFLQGSQIKISLKCIELYI